MKILKTEKGLIKMWNEFVPEFQDNTMQQLKDTASMPFIYKHLAVMPDAHLGKGSTIGTVIATKKAVIPSAVGVDIGCGMMAVRTNLTANDLPDSLAPMRSAIEAVVPVGFDKHDSNNIPLDVIEAWKQLKPGHEAIMAKHPLITAKEADILQISSLGSGNHFVELCIDTEDAVWVMLHSGSRGIGNRIGTYFITKAKELMEKMFINLPNSDLAYLAKDTEIFDDYMFAMNWAQNYAMVNRQVMMIHTIKAIEATLGVSIEYTTEAVNCHHNYVTMEHHFGSNVYVTRKGAVNAREGVMGIIPGSMGAKSFIVKGRGEKESFCSCSHGAGRVMSRTQAKKLVNLDTHIKDTAGVECKKDDSVLDETPSAYKNIDDVMKSQEDLVEIVHTLKQVLCVKG